MAERARETGHRDVAARAQFIEQDPGPRGSPHDPQGPIDSFAEKAAPPLAPTAKAERRFRKSSLSQDGHDGVWSARVRYSNW